MQNTNKLVFCDNVHVKIISMKSDDDAIAVSKLAYCEAQKIAIENYGAYNWTCLLYTSPSPRDTR